VSSVYSCEVGCACLQEERRRSHRNSEVASNDGDEDGGEKQDEEDDDDDDDDGSGHSQVLHESEAGDDEGAVVLTEEETDEENDAETDEVQMSDRRQSGDGEVAVAFAATCFWCNLKHGFPVQLYGESLNIWISCRVQRWLWNSCGKSNQSGRSCGICQGQLYFPGKISIFPAIVNVIISCFLYFDVKKLAWLGEVGEFGCLERDNPVNKVLRMLILPQFA